MFIAAESRYSFQSLQNGAIYIIASFYYDGKYYYLQIYFIIWKMSILNG